MASVTRVLFLIESLAGGGAEKVLDTLVRHLDSKRYRVTVCSVVDTGPYSASVARNCDYRPMLRPSTTRLGRWCYRIKYHLIYRWLPRSVVYRLYVPHDNDVEVAFCEGFATGLLAHSSNSHASHLAWVHLDLHAQHYTRSSYRGDADETRCYNRYNHIVAVSDTTRDAFHKEFPDVTTPVVTINNPVDVEAIRTAAATESVALPPRSAGRVRLVTVGRLVPQKGFDRLLNAVSLLVADGRDVELWIVGEGEQRADLERGIASHALSDRVKLWGFKRNPYPYMAAGDIFVCSSRAEGYSLVIAEAMVLGLPVVSTRCAGPDILLGEGRYGMLVDNATGDDAADSAVAGALYAALTRLLADADLLNRYRSASATRAADFGVDATLRQFDSLISD